MNRARKAAIWTALTAAIIVPLAFAASSPQLEWRQPIYIAAGFAGVCGLALMLLQPLLAGGYLPDLQMSRGRRIHRWFGGLLVVAVLVHVAALWITSPPDVVDALLFRSATPFAAWGVMAMWAVFAAALLAVLRRRFRASLRIWRLGHTTLVAVAVVGTVVHAIPIEGTMETVSKIALCALVLLATAKAITDLKVWGRRSRQRP